MGLLDSTFGGGDLFSLTPPTFPATTSNPTIFGDVLAGGGVSGSDSSSASSSGSSVASTVAQFLGLGIQGFQAYSNYSLAQAAENSPRASTFSIDKNGNPVIGTASALTGSSSSLIWIIIIVVVLLLFMRK